MYKRQSPFVEHLRRISAERGNPDLMDAIGSVLSLPLMARERRVGIMTLVHGQRGYYTAPRVEVAMAFAAQAAVAIENARLAHVPEQRHHPRRGRVGPSAGQAVEERPPVSYTHLYCNPSLGRYRVNCR